jgi:hypothetical protein
VNQADAMEFDELRVPADVGKNEDDGFDFHRGLFRRTALR